jgi:polar amino acid transport system substrate-binding protein
VQKAPSMKMCTAPPAKFGAIAAFLLLSTTACTSMNLADPAPIHNAATRAAQALTIEGRLRAAINFGNPILANKDAITGEPAGVSVDLARELARRLRVPLDLVTFTAAGKVVEAVAANEVSIAFVAIDQERATSTAYTAPYVVIEGAYLVRNGSALKSNDEVDRAGTRVAAAKGSAYDLYLSRELKQASLVHASTSQAVTDTFLALDLDVAAGVKQQLQMDAARLPGLRLLPGRFMVINQAMGTPISRARATDYLKAFIEEMKASGFVAASIARHGIKGALVADAAP